MPRESRACGDLSKRSGDAPDGAAMDGIKLLAGGHEGRFGLLGPDASGGELRCRRVQCGSLIGTPSRVVASASLSAVFSLRASASALPRSAVSLRATASALSSWAVSLRAAASALPSCAVSLRASASAMRPRSTALAVVAPRPPDKMKNTMCRETCPTPQIWQAYAPARARTRTEYADSTPIQREDGPPAAEWLRRLEFLRPLRERPACARGVRPPARRQAPPRARRSDRGRPRADHRCSSNDRFRA
jgi:hypothetical protein